MTTKLIFTLFFLASHLLAAENHKGKAANISRWASAVNIIEVCYYEHVFIAANVHKTNGKLSRRATHQQKGVITRVIKGPLKVGTKLVKINIGDVNSKTLGFKKVIEGKIEVVFLNKNDFLANEDGSLQTISNLTHFDRVIDKDCWRALQTELQKSVSSSTKKANR